MKLVKKAKRGFTLVELVVVIAVIAILAAVSVGAYFGVTESANNSRLEQETKQIHTAIQTISLGTKPTQSMSKNGLIISNEIEFEGDLDEALGTDYDVFVGETPNTVAKPTVVFKTTTFTKNEVGQPTVYKTFEYYNPEISSKYVEADVVTGDFNIVKNDDVTIDTTADIRTLYYVDHPTFSTENPYVYMWDSENNPAVEWPGDQILSLVGTYDTYEENETVNVYKFTVDVNKFTNFIFNHGNNQPQTVNCSYDKESSNNAFVANGLTNNENKYVIVNREYVVGEWNYGRFLEPGSEPELTSYYFIDNNAFTGSLEEYYVHIFNKESETVKAKYPGEKLSVYSTITTGSNGVFNIFKIDVDRNLFNYLVISKVDETKITEENKGVSVKTQDLSLTDLDNGGFNLYAATYRFTPDMSYFCVPGLFESGKWDYGQFETVSNNKTYYFLDQKTFSDAGSLYVYPFSSSTGEVKDLFPGYEYNATLQEEVAITSIGSTHGIVNIYSITINRALYDTVIFSSVKSNEKKMQTVDINLATADSDGYNLFALSAETNDASSYEVIAAAKDGNNIEYGQKWFDEASYKLVSFLKPEHWNWAQVKIHYWGGVTSSTWPGELMEESEGTYSFYVPEDTTNVQFNDGTNANQLEFELIDGYHTYNAYVNSWMNENYEFSTEPNVRILGNFLNQDKWDDSARSGENVLNKQANIYSSGEFTLYSGDYLKVVFNSSYFGYSNLIDENETFTKDDSDNLVLNEEKDGIYTFTFNVLNGEITYTLVNSIDPHSHTYDTETHYCICGERDPNYVDPCEHNYEGPVCTKCNADNPNWKIYYFKPMNDWKISGARFKAILKKNTTGNEEIIMDHFDFKDYFTFSIDTSLYSKITIHRLNPENLSKWNGSSEFTLDKTKNLITQPNGSWDNWSGNYSNYDGVSTWTIGIIGTMDNWTNDNPMVKNSDGNYETTLTFAVNTEFKIRANSAWTYSWGGKDLAASYPGIQSGGDNIKVTTAGTYTITFNPITLKISIS